MWDAITDPHLLSECVPGCQSITQVTDTLYTGQIHAKVGPVKAVFRGQLTLENLVIQQSHTMVVEGQGGLAGLAKARADVQLKALENEQTELHYQASTELTGLINRLASRLLTGTAYRYVDGFFARFQDAVLARHQASPSLPPGTDG